MAVKISLSITQNSQSVVNNTSNVTVKATLKWDYGSYNATGECYGSIKIDGTNYSFSGLKFNTGQSTSGSQVIMTKTVNVKHGSDGTKTLNCSTSFYTGVSSGTITASASKALTKILRQSTISANNGTLGVAQTLTVTRHSSGYTHTVKYTCGSASGTICTKSSSTSLSFTPALTLASQNTTGTSVSIKFTITTYSGSTTIGSSTKTITCSIPSSVKPSCTITVSDAAGYSVYVKGYSKFKITVTPTTSYGSAIASYSVKANGTTYTTASVTTSVLASSGTLTITATVKDKRGRTGTATKTVTVYDKSTLSANNGILATEQNLTISRGHSGFKHTITYSCGNASGTLATKTSDTTIKFTPPIGLATQNTTGTTVSVKFTITTYCDDKNIGSNTKTITCTMPESVAPTVSINTEDTTGFANTYGAMIKGLSNLKVNLSAVSSFGSDIVSYSTTISNMKYTSTSFVVGMIESTEDIVITTTVTDKRGRTGSSQFVVSGILDYILPSISKFSVGRCNEDGTENDKGEFVKVSCAASVTPLNNLNLAEVIIMYKKATETQWQVGKNINFNDDLYKYVLDEDFILPADSGSSYDITLTVGDSHNSIARKTSVSTGFTLLHWGADGKSIGVGKVAEITECFDLGLKIRLGGGLVPFILPDEVDLDKLKTPNFYTSGSAETVKNYVNCPVTSGTFDIEVTAAGNEGQIKQTITTCSKTSSKVFERFFYQDAWGEWVRTSDFGNTLLWSGVYYMTAGHTCPLTEPISKQLNGVVLVFSYYSSGAQDYNFHTFYISKKEVETHNGLGHNFIMSTQSWDYVSNKYIYIWDDRLVGHDNNNKSGTGTSGIAYDNSRFVLRYVIGV